MIKRLLIFAVFLAAVIFGSRANAQVNVFTDHQVIHMLSHGVNKYDDIRFPTGDYPYIGRIGLEYQRNKWSYQLSYIHRSNVDITGQDEYNYNGIALGVKYSHCIKSC